MYYFNLIIFYSLLGFILESVVYKINNSNSHSSIFYGPYTLVYGFGAFLSIITYNFLNKFLDNSFFSYLIYYLILTTITTLIEYIGGHIIHYFFKIDKWNYSYNKFHFGKYICLKNSLFWGILTLFIIFNLHNFFNQNILLKIPKYVTKIIFVIFIIDLILVIKNKIIKKQT